jgi:cobaltochelatase CobN
MGGKKGFAGFDRVVSTMRDMRIPVFASDVQNDPEVVTASTLDKADYQKIYKYIAYGGLKNYENLLLFLANRFTCGTYEINPPKQMPLEGIYHPQLGQVLTLTEYMEKKYSPEKPTVGVLFHHDPVKSGDVTLANSLLIRLSVKGRMLFAVLLVNNVAARTCVGCHNFFMLDGKPWLMLSSVHWRFFSGVYASSEPVDNCLRSWVCCPESDCDYNTFEEWRDSCWGLNSVKLLGMWLCGI